jgi:hypothetical protein
LAVHSGQYWAVMVTRAMATAEREKPRERETLAWLGRMSRVAKLGGIPASYTESSSCPPSCALRGAGCYAEVTRARLQWNRVDSGKVGGPWSQFCREVAALPRGILWRHNVAGDLPGRNDRLDRAACLRLANANRGRRGFTFTHYPLIEGLHGERYAPEKLAAHNRAVVAEMLARGFTVNASADSVAHADRIRAGAPGIPVAALLPQNTTARAMRTPAGRKIVTCPETYRSDLTCAQCGICANRSPARAVVGFPAHGPRARKADAIARA